MTFVKKRKVIGLTAIFLAIFSVTMLCLAQLGEDGIPRLDKGKKYVKEYVIGQEGIKGAVNMSYMGNDPSYEIGADKDGYAVFKNPEKAFSQMKIDLYKGLEAIKEERNLPPIDNRNFLSYKVYGWHMNNNHDEEALAQARKVTRFLDIYENSFYVTEPYRLF